MTPTTLCRDCLTEHTSPGRCPACGSRRHLRHDELSSLSTAHVDCDAFYASVEKRDDPAIRDKPVIIGGGKRGVVSTCCYIARIKGVRSAMPMFKALKLCPEAVVIPPRMAKYVEVSRAIRAMMFDLTPLVEPLSLDEAFLDLAGTERLHRAPPAVLLARLQARVESELGITVSVGLSHNKFLAKIASDLDKPRGFAVIGRAETRSFLDPKPVGLIWGVGAAAVASLEREGIRTIGDLRQRERKYLIERFGALGDRLWHLSHGTDTRSVSPSRAPKSISHETTFETDISDRDTLRRHLWLLSEELSARAKAKGVGGKTVTLKLKRADFALMTRRRGLESPTQLADLIFRAAEPLLLHDLARGPFRLIGVGVSDLCPADRCDPGDDLLDAGANKRRERERAADLIRSRFGPAAIRLGRALP
jgi:DNA polymerase-4